MPTPIDRLLAENWLIARYEHAAACDPPTGEVPPWLAEIERRQAQYRNASAALARRLAEVGEIHAYCLTFRLNVFNRVVVSRAPRFPLRRLVGSSCAA